jgi:GNAT superfamily N-acetyltransferase
VAESERDWVIEELSADHDRSAFSCGQPSLDEFLTRYAGQNQRTGICKTYVAVRVGRNTADGYYAISAGAVAFTDIPQELRKRLPKYPVPVAHLGRLAVDASSQGHGLGELLLLDALTRILRAAESVGMHAVEVVAIDDAAQSFYLKYGFTELLDDPLRLYISIKTLRQLDLI